MGKEGLLTVKLVLNLSLHHMQLSQVYIKKGVRIICYKLASTSIGCEECLKFEVLLRTTRDSSGRLRIPKDGLSSLLKNFFVVIKLFIGEPHYKAVKT